MVKSGTSKRKRKNSNSTTPESSQVEQPKAVASVVGAGENRTLAACMNRPRPSVEEDKYSYSASNSSIPTEIIFNILLLLPASILRDVMRFVCKEWNAIISNPLFIRAHLFHSLSSPGLGFLCQGKDLHYAKSNWAFYIHTNNAAADATVGYSWSKLKFPFRAKLLGSCNGLVLLQSARTQKALKDLFVVNLVTKAKTRLPPLIRAGVHILCMPSSTIAFVPSSGQYKVVYVSFVSKDKQAAYVYYRHIEDLCAEVEVKVMVCTIAVDKTWRAIDSKGITMSKEVKMTLIRRRPSISSGGGHIYWFHEHHSYGLALDVDAETMYQFTGPKDYLFNYRFTETVKTDTGVGMVHLQAPDKHWKMWELIGPPKTGTWSQATDIDAACVRSALESHFNPCSCGYLVPVLFSLKRGELWVYCAVSGQFRLICYNWKTGSVWSPPIRWPSFPDLPIPIPHVNSLLSLKNLLTV